MARSALAQPVALLERVRVVLRAGGAGPAESWSSKEPLRWGSLGCSKRHTQLRPTCGCDRVADPGGEAIELICHPLGVQMNCVEMTPLPAIAL